MFVEIDELRDAVCVAGIAAKELGLPLDRFEIPNWVDP
jgi:hypothetical protein